MATLSITVPDAAVARIRAAFTRTIPPGPPVLPNQAQVEQEIKDWVHSRVIAYEAAAGIAPINQQRDAEIQAVRDQLATETW